MAAWRRALSAALLLAAASGEVTDALCDASDACDSSAAGEDTAILMQVKVKQRATQVEGLENVKYLPRSGVPIVNYHLASPSGSEPSMSERGEAQSWIVNMKTPASDEGIRRFCDAAKQAGSRCKAEGHPTKQGVAFASVDATEAQLDEMAESFGGVAFLEADGTLKVPEDDWQAQESKSALAQKSDTTVATPWGLDRSDTNGPYTNMDGSYTPPENNDGENTHVYVADTGIRASHHQFGGRAAGGADFTSGSTVVCGTAQCAWDNHGHGTHCAGTIGGTDFGVARRTRLYAVKVLSDSGSGAWSWIIGGLDWVASSGQAPRVFSASLGGGGQSTSVETAVNNAVAAGVTVVVAAGNSNANARNFSPAFVAAAITVGSSDSFDRMSSFSNHDSCVDIFAPGSSVLSCGITSDTAESTKSGTSMACPHVAGAAALLLANNPALSPNEVVTKLTGDALADMLPPSPDYGTAPNLLLFVGDIGPAPTPGPPLPPCLRQTAEEPCVSTGTATPA